MEDLLELDDLVVELAYLRLVTLVGERDRLLKLETQLALRIEAALPQLNLLTHVVLIENQNCFTQGPEYHIKALKRDDSYL